MARSCEASIIGGTVIIHGTVVGNVTATQIHRAQAAGQVKGDLHTPALTIERGATYDGTCKMDAAGGRAPPPPGGEKR